MKIHKKIFLSVSITAFFLSASYFGALYYVEKCLDLNKYKDKVFSEIEEKTGFKVFSENISVKKTYTPDLKINMYHTLILYPDNNEFLKLKSLDVKIKLLPLLFKKVIIKDTSLTRPIINIKLNKDLTTSLDKYITNKNIITEGFQLDTSLSNIHCSDYKIKIYDESLGKNFVLEGDELLIKDFKINENVNFVLKGVLKDDTKKYLEYDLSVISFFNSEKSAFTFSPFKPMVESDIKGKIIGNLKITNDKKITGKLKINDVSLRAKDVELKDNNVNLDFKGEEVNIDAILHTSKTDIAKVKGDFIYGKKKLIKLNADAKHVNLENLFKIISIISKSLNIKNSIADLNVKGLMDAEFNISSDFKKLISNGNLRIINAEIRHEKLPYPVKSVNADISLDNNNIRIKQANALINQTPVEITGGIKEDVSFDVNAKSENLNLINIINLFDVKNKIPFEIIAGKLGFKSNIKGVLNKNYTLTSMINLNSLNIKEPKNNIPLMISNADITFSGDEKKYSGEVNCKNLNIIVAKQKISADNLNIKFDENKILIPENEIISPLKVNFSGEINNYKEKISGAVNFKSEAQAQKLYQIINEYIKQPSKSVGIIKTTGDITLWDNKVNLKLKMLSDKDNYISYTVIQELLNKKSLLNLNCDIDKNNIIIQELSLMEDKENLSQKKDYNFDKNKKTLKISGVINTENDILFKNLNINIPDSLTFASSFFGGEETSLNGNIILNNTLEKPEITGNLKIFSYKLKRYLTDVKNADLSFMKNNIRLTAPDVQVADSKFNITADIEPDITPKKITVSNLQLNSLNLDLNTIYSIIEKERNPFAQNIISVKKGYAAIGKFKVLDLNANDIITDIALEQNIIKLSNIKAKAYNGEIEGKMSYDLPHSLLDIKIKGKGLNIKDSLYDLCKISDDLGGIADIETDLSIVIGKTYNNVIKSLNGKLNYKAYNGQMGTLGKFEYYLYAKNLMYHGLLNSTINRFIDAIKRDNTARYRISEGTILFQNGYLITDNIKTIGENMSIWAKGRHNMLTNEANIVIQGRISDEIKNKLGTFGNFSLSDLISDNKTQKDINYMKLPNDIMKNIPDLYKSPNTKTNTFTVNIYGNINSINAINSFMWTVPKNIQNNENETDIETHEEIINSNNNTENIENGKNYENNNPVENTEQNSNLPDFNDMLQDL